MHVVYENDGAAVCNEHVNNDGRCIEVDASRTGRPSTGVVDSVGSTLKRLHYDITHFKDPEYQEQHKKKEYWITRHFQGLQCTKYFQNTSYPKDSTICMCGLKLDEHKDPKDAIVSAELDTTAKWSSETCTQGFRTNAYGHINFTNIEADFLPKYIRFKYNTDIKYIRELILDKWKLPKTYLIMVVIGGLGEQIRESDDNNTDNKNRYRKVNTETFDYINKIKDGLVEAALSTQAWIITSGVDSGVSKLVGRAVGTRRTFTQTIPTLGIAAWGTIRDSAHLVANDGQGLFPANYTVTEKSRVSNLVGLDHNHTSFLFPDFGTYRNFHVQEMTKLKINIEIALKDATESNMITILIEGGLYSIIETKDRIKNKIPIVVMKGTGRAADLIGCAKLLFDIYGRDRNSLDFQNELKEAFVEHFNVTADSSDHTKEAFDAILTIIESEHLVTIWDPKKADKGKIDKAILLGLINSLSEPDSGSSKNATDTSDDSSTEQTTSTDRITEYHREFNQLELAIKWNRLDLAEEHLFKGKQFTVQQLNALLWIALEHKEEGFVTAIMKKGASVKYFLTEKRFWGYLNSKANGKTALKKMLKKHASKKCRSGDETNFIYEHFEEVIYEISQGVYKCPKKYSPTEDRNALLNKHGNLLNEICGVGYNHVKKNIRKEFCKRTHTSKQDFEDPESLLVLYFVLIQEHDIAKCLWRYSRTPLILSLICAHICQWLADQEKRRKEITGEDKEQLRKFSDEWEELAIKIVDETRENYDTQWVKQLVRHKFYSWKGRSSLEIASYMKSKKFIAHPSVHVNVTNMWMGALDSDTSYMSILMGIFITPIFIDIKKHKQIINSAVSEADIKEKQRSEFINQQKTLTHSDTEASLHKKGCSPKHSIKHGFYKFITFHKAPVTKYFVNLIFYLLFLSIFLCALIINEENSQYFLRRYSTTKFSIFEWTVIIYITSSIPLEFRQIYHSMPSTLSGKLKCYISSSYNKNDVAGFIILAMAVLTKMGYFMLGNSITYEMYNILAYKTLMGLTFTLSATRLLQFLQINSKMGPKITTIARMMYDLLFFVLIISIFIMAYGVATEAIIFPMGKNNSLVELFNFIWRPYIHLFGELALEDLDDQLAEGYCKLFIKLSKNASTSESQCDSEDTRTQIFSCDDDRPCQYAKLVIQMALMIYMILASALMLNLLIAVFSKTYDNMYSKQDLHWKWQRYELMMEFKHRSAIPFPLNIVGHVWRVARWVWRRCCTRGSIGYFERRDAQKKNDEFKKAEISLLERECLRNIIKQIEERTDAEKDDSNKNSPIVNRIRSTSPTKRIIPKPYGHQQSEDIDDTEIDSLLVQAQNIPVIFSSPTTPPLTRKETKLPTLIGDIPENTYYPDPKSKTIRYSMPAEKRDWNTPFPNYKPAFLNINDKEDLQNEEWNAAGKNASYEGHYLVEKGHPHNPLGRTGVFGKGLLQHYGPNFKSIPILTRFQNPTEASALDTPLEVLVHIANSNKPKECRLPEFKSRRDEPITQELTELLLNSVPSSDNLVLQNIKRLLRRGILIKRGAVDSEYNTDNSWWEVFITSYHDDDDDALRHVSFDVNGGYRWVKASEKMFKDSVHSKYFDRVIYNRRVSRYIGHSVNI